MKRNFQETKRNNVFETEFETLKFSTCFLDQSYTISLCVRRGQKNIMALYFLWQHYSAIFNDVKDVESFKVDLKWPFKKATIQFLNRSFLDLSLLTSHHFK
jgi:hypothetical protein